MSELKITKANFEAEVLQSDVPVLVDFYADWCGPCKMLAPIVERIANEYDGKIKVGKVNVDNEPELAVKFRVVSIPTLLVFEKGAVKASHVGILSKSEIEDMIK